MERERGEEEEEEEEDDGGSWLIKLLDLLLPLISIPRAGVVESL